MILQGIAGENREVRVAWDGPRAWRLLESQGLPVPGGVAGGGRALRIATVACAVRLVSETIGCFPMRSFNGDGLQRQPVYNDPAARLFQDPTPGHGAAGISSFDFWSDIAAGPELEYASVIWKVKDASGKVVELWPLDAGYFTVQADGRQRRVFAKKPSNGQVVDVTSDVVFVRGWSERASVVGTPALQLHDRGFRWAAAYEEYRGRFFEQDGSVNQVIEGGPSDSKQRREMAKGWHEMVGGKRNAGKVGILWGDAKLKSLGANLRDAQAADLATAVAQDVARAFRIYPAGPLYASAAGSRSETIELTSGLFQRFTLLHRERRIERAFAADPDLYPDKSLYPRFDTTEFIRGDMATMATIAHELLQDGTINRDESRALALGLGPIPDGLGQVFVQHPVGAGPGMVGPGAPGKQAPPAEASADVFNKFIDLLADRMVATNGHPPSVGD